MRIGSLFSGIGGLELGLERAGVGHTVWQVEQDEYCRAVLARHWPDAQRFTDVRTVGSGNLAPVDVICGGFPCQDVSATGRRRGIIAGTRSGLWFEYSRILRELRPRYAIVENVTGLLFSRAGRCSRRAGHDRVWRGDGELAQLAMKVEDYAEFLAMSHRACNSKRTRYWPTPTVSMHRGSSRGAMTRKTGKSRENDRLDYAVERGETELGYLNPAWVEWLMGFPPEHSVSKRSATPSSRKSRKSSGKSSSKSTRNSEG